MRSNTAVQQGGGTRRLLVALLAVVATALPVALPQVAQAATSKRVVKITRTVSPSTVMTGQAVGITGTVTPAPTGSLVALQRYASGQWTTVARARVNYRDRYSFRIVPATGQRYYRVYSRPDARRYSGTSYRASITALSCTAKPAPSRPVEAWFADNRGSSTSEIASRMGRTFCAAAPGSRVNVAMYFIRTGAANGDVEAILTPLERMARFKGVKVRILLEGKLYTRTSPLYPTLARLRSFAQVVLCEWGCRNEQAAPLAGGGRAISHHKFVTISDMSWASGVDPLVVSSSANWSQSQLRYHWQSAIMTYKDAALTREFDLQWEALATCAGALGCSYWSNRLTRWGLPSDGYGLQPVEQVWRDVVPRERPGSAGHGSGVLFSPWGGADDPVATALQQFTCQPGSSVRVAHMFLTRQRNRVLYTLKALQNAGCDVRLLFSADTDSGGIEGIAKARSLLLPVTCVARVHEKAIIVDAVRKETGTRERALWTGSHSLSGTALAVNDETLLRLSVERAGSPYAAANVSVFDTYQNRWTELSQRAVPCGSVPDTELR